MMHQLLVYCFSSPNLPFMAQQTRRCKHFSLRDGMTLSFVSRGFWRGTAKKPEKGTSFPGSGVLSFLLTLVAFLWQGKRGGVGGGILTSRQFLWSSTSALADFPVRPAALPWAAPQQVFLVLPAPACNTSMNFCAIHWVTAIRSLSQPWEWGLSKFVPSLGTLPQPWSRS